MISLPVIEASEVGAARRRAVQEGETIGLSAEDRDRLALLVTEAGTNLVRHARDGEIILCPWTRGGSSGIDVIALDAGPGLRNVEAAMSDGYTTASEDEGRGLGGGLGAIKRMSDGLDIHTDAQGTTLVIAIGKAKRAKARPIETAGLVVPKPGFTEGGDAFGLRAEAQETLVMLMDVLGHGPAAAAEARKGVAAFTAAKGASLEETETLVSEALRGGRGAAALIVALPHGPGMLHAIGLGNVKGEIALSGGITHGIPSVPGIVGATPKRPRRTEHNWTSGDTLLLSTDGLRGAERTPESSSLLFRDPLTVAATLYKRRRRGTDDCGVVVARAKR